MDDSVLLAHGGGGLLSDELIRELVAPRFRNEHLDRMDDSAVLRLAPGRVALTTDSYVVSPLFFPGGNIGDLAVCGTVNDLAMAGARPQYITLSLIIEEGFARSELELVLDSIRVRCLQSGVRVVGGDTKVVPRGAADGLFINTSGVGVVPDGLELSSHNARPGDAVIVSGAVGLHGLAVMLCRGDLKLQTPVRSDVAPLNAVVQRLVDEKIAARTLRDLTRGGLAMALYDIGRHSGVTVELEQDRLPQSDAAQSACELLGLDPLYVACEGRLVAVVAPDDAERAVELMRQVPAASEAAVVGHIIEKTDHAIELVTSVGSRRVVSPPRGEQMPRIC
ncbi:MAG: hydrogenase expression/formation protein HypE [Planctomycetota bacterium]